VSHAAAQRPTAPCPAGALGATLQQQKDALMLLRGSIDPSQAVLTTWTFASNPCSWGGRKAQVGTMVAIFHKKPGIVVHRFRETRTFIHGQN
jgi:hypothetical protein